jgi:hypothetical protein
LAIAVTYLWIGFVCAISFMEAWQKFRAPGVNLSIGLGIGRLVFAALNKVEWFFAIALIVNFYISGKPFFSFQNSWFFLPFIFLILQTIWLLPALDARAQLHIDGAQVPPSNLHFYYVGMEIMKVTGLFIFSIKLFN